MIKTMIYLATKKTALFGLIYKLVKSFYCVTTSLRLLTLILKKSLTTPTRGNGR